MIGNGWYAALVNEVRKLEFAGVVTTKHAIGKRILADFEKFGSPEYGAKKIQSLSKDVGIDKSDLYSCIEFAKRYPELSISDRQSLPDSWRRIRLEVLPKTTKEVDVTPPKAVAGDFQIVYADPPWLYGNSATRANAKSHYPCMSIEDIANLPKTEETFPHIADDAILFLWATPPMLRDIWPVFDGWGFEYKTVAFFWAKENTDGGWYFGIGNYTRSNVEPCLIGKRGKGLPRVNNSISNMQTAKRLKHSEKPHLFRDLITQMYGDVSKVELFARQTSPGWSTWGNQVEIGLYG
jgi:N6-adenosine-specific RNA methylase IME4